MSRFKLFSSVFIGLLLTSLLFPVIAHAAKPRSYRIGVENIDYYPHFAFGYRDNSFAKEVLECFFNSQNLTVTFVPLPLKRFNQWYIENNIDFKYPDNEDWRRDETVKLPVIYSTEVIKLTAGATVPFKLMGRPRNQIKRLGTVLGFHPTMWSDRIESKQTIMLSDPNVLSVVKMNINGIVDVINLDYSVIHYHLKQMKRPKALIMDSTLPHRAYGFHLSTLKHPQIISQFNHFYQQNQTFIEAMKHKYQIIDDPFDLDSF